MDTIWQELLTGLQNIFAINLESTSQISMITKQEYIQLYTMIYNNCNSKQTIYPGKPGIAPKEPAKVFYERLCLFITSYITSLSSETKIQTTDTGLQKFNKTWENYNLSSVITSNLFNYINRIWVKSMMEKTGGVL